MPSRLVVSFGLLLALGWSAASSADPQDDLVDTFRLAPLEALTHFPSLSAGPLTLNLPEFGQVTVTPEVLSGSYLSLQFKSSEPKLDFKLLPNHGRRYLAAVGAYQAFVAQKNQRGKLAGNKILIVEAGTYRISIRYFGHRVFLHSVQRWESENGHPDWKFFLSDTVAFRMDEQGNFTLRGTPKDSYTTSLWGNLWEGPLSTRTHILSDTESLAAKRTISDASASLPDRVIFEAGHKPTLVSEVYRTEAFGAGLSERDREIVEALEKVELADLISADMDLQGIPQSVVFRQGEATVTVDGGLDDQGVAHRYRFSNSPTVIDPRQPEAFERLEKAFWRLRGILSFGKIQNWNRFSISATGSAIGTYRYAAEFALVSNVLVLLSLNRDGEPLAVRRFTFDRQSGTADIAISAATHLRLNLYTGEGSYIREMGILTFPSPLFAIGGSLSTRRQAALNIFPSLVYAEDVHRPLSTQELVALMADGALPKDCAQKLLLKAQEPK